MLDQTQLDLAMAYAMESRAAARNQAFALKADQENRAQEAIFFRAAARAQSVVAKRLLMLLRGKISATEENIVEAFEQELPERLQDYNQYQERGAGPAVSAFKQALEIGRRQQEFYQRLKRGEAQSYRVCAICGCLLPGDHEENCPVCGAVPEKIEVVD
jgi:rubrerythrin